jgi:putative ABC transport system permease protein
MAVGGVLAVLGARVLGALLLDLSPHDPIALGGMSLLLLGVVVVATWLPARRAARVDPARSLRVE